ncbi:MAG: InlB B-repeat-containing protein [Treponema sp.]|nr:InlB B-repeat-containing protein [Treponema sp.]
MKKTSLFFTAFSLFVFLISCKTDPKSVYKIEFEDNYGYATVPSPIEVEEGTEVTLPNLKSSKYPVSFRGWRLEGWTTDKNLASTITINKNMTLIANWELNVGLYANGGTFKKGQTHESVVVFPVKFGRYGKPETHSFCTPEFKYWEPKREGYTFVGWTFEDGTHGATLYSDNLGSFYPEGFYVRIPEKRFNLYAVWKEGTNIKYMDGSMTESEVQSVMESLRDGDILFLLPVILSGNVPQYWQDSFKNYLQDETKKITVDLSYCEESYPFSGAFQVFQNCSSIESLIIGRNCQYYTRDVELSGLNVWNCENLKSVSVKYSNFVENKEYIGYSKIFFADLPDSVESITLGKYMDGVWCRGRQLNNLESFVFEDTNGWYISSEDHYKEAESKSDLISIDVSDPEINARNCRSNGIWFGKYFYKISE